MTAPDPTAGERAWCGCVIGGLHRYECAGVGHVDPPAVAASTGTSEDVEALATVLHRLHDPDAVHVLSCEKCRPIANRLAAREAAVRAEERERTLREFRRLAVRCYPKGMVPTPQVIADLNERIAREVRP